MNLICYKKKCFLNFFLNAERYQSHPIIDLLFNGKYLIYVNKVCYSFFNYNYINHNYMKFVSL